MEIKRNSKKIFGLLMVLLPGIFFGMTPSTVSTVVKVGLFSRLFPSLYTHSNEKSSLAFSQIDEADLRNYKESLSRFKMPHSFSDNDFSLPNDEAKFKKHYVAGGIAATGAVGYKLLKRYNKKENKEIPVVQEKEKKELVVPAASVLVKRIAKKWKIKKGLQAQEKPKTLNEEVRADLIQEFKPSEQNPQILDKSAQDLLDSQNLGVEKEKTDKDVVVEDPNISQKDKKSRWSKVREDMNAPLFGSDDDFTPRVKQKSKTNRWAQFQKELEDQSPFGEDEAPFEQTQDFDEHLKNLKVQTVEEANLDEKLKSSWLDSLKNIVRNVKGFATKSKKDNGTSELDDPKDAIDLFNFVLQSNNLRDFEMELASSGLKKIYDSITEEDKDELLNDYFMKMLTALNQRDLNEIENDKTLSDKLKNKAKQLKIQELKGQIFILYHYFIGDNGVPSFLRHAYKVPNSESYYIKSQKDLEQEILNYRFPVLSDELKMPEGLKKLMDEQSSRVVTPRTGISISHRSFRDQTPRIIPQSPFIKKDPTQEISPVATPRSPGVLRDQTPRIGPDVFIGSSNLELKTPRA